MAEDNGNLGRGLDVVGAGLSAGLSSYNRGTQTKVEHENDLREALYRERNFNPMAPYQRLAKGQMYASLMRAWGYDKMLGNDFLNFISNKSNYAGTRGIGGRDYDSVESAGFKRSGSLLGDIFGGVAAGLGAIIPG